MLHKIKFLTHQGIYLMYLLQCLIIFLLTVEVGVVYILSYVIPSVLKQVTYLREYQSYFHQTFMFGFCIWGYLFNWQNLMLIKSQRFLRPEGVKVFGKGAPWWLLLVLYSPLTKQGCIMHLVIMHLKGLDSKSEP